MKHTHLSTLPSEPVSHNPEIQKQIMIRSGVIPNLTNFSTAIFKPGQETTVHHHEDMYEVFFVSKGEGIININGEDYKLDSGACFVIEPKDDHLLKNTGEEDLHLIYFGVKDMERRAPARLFEAP